MSNIKSRFVGWLNNIDQDLLRGTLFIVLDIQPAWPSLVVITGPEREEVCIWYNCLG